VHLAGCLAGRDAHRDGDFFRYRSFRQLTRTSTHFPVVGYCLEAFGVNGGALSIQGGESVEELLLSGGIPQCLRHMFDSSKTSAEKRFQRVTRYGDGPN